MVGTNKGADAVVLGDAEEVRRRGEAGEPASKDTGLRLGYRTTGTAPATPPSTWA